MAPCGVGGRLNPLISLFTHPLEPSQRRGMEDHQSERKVERDRLIQQEAERRLRKRLKNTGKLTSTQIDAVLAEELAKEKEKVREGEEWVKSISGAIKMFNSGKPFVSEYVGFKDGRRTFKIEY